MADIGLGSGRKDRSDQTVALKQAFGQVMCANAAGTFIVLPTRPFEVTSNNTFDWKHFGSLDQHRPTAKLVVSSNDRRHFFEICRQKMVVNQLIKLPEPERRKLGQDLTLSRYRSR